MKIAAPMAQTTMSRVMAQSSLAAAMVARTLCALARKLKMICLADAVLGIVRLTGLEMADRKRSRLSRGELTPFSERGNAVLFEDIAGIKVAV